jgi:hypothetical protein
MLKEDTLYSNEKGVRYMLNKTSSSECESCAYYFYDDEYEEQYCDIDMDEDDACRLMEHPESHCPYYRNNDEYAVVRHQM